jgi:hypothetical protein
MARIARARSPVLLLTLGLLLLGLLATAAASTCPGVSGRGSSSSSLRRPPPLFIVGPRRAGWVAGATGVGGRWGRAGVGGRWGRTRLGARKRKVSDVGILVGGGRGAWACAD